MSVVRVERYAGVVPGVYSDNDENAHLGAEGIFLGAKVDNAAGGCACGGAGGGGGVGLFIEEGAEDGTWVVGFLGVDSWGAAWVVGSRR